MRSRTRNLLVLASFAALAMGCQHDVDESPPTSSRAMAVDDVTAPPEGMSLVTLEPDADLDGVVRTIERLDGNVFQVLAPRMIVAQLPAGAEAVLTDHGMIAHYERAVTDIDVGHATVAESRFARVFSNRYYPAAVPPGQKIERLYAPVQDGEAFETDTLVPEMGPAKASAAGALVDSTAAIEAESFVYVPYASGTVVVSVWLPESNGVGEPSTEDWTEDAIVAVYDKIQNALEAIKRHEPNSNLRFVMHYESAPANGGLEGTIDHDWEFGKQANWGAGNNESRSVAAMLSRLLGRDVTNDVWQANRDYLSGLKERYSADGAFYVMVADNGNGTGALRAHAYLNGPSTTLYSGNGWNVFMHEFGHIFGALDEYCPDACQSPNRLGGYLGVINANATFRAGEPGGINDGQGENQPSLMAYNIVNAVNGYTRGAWGWLDTDGDGIVEVRDTTPRSDVNAVVEDSMLFVRGEVVDVPTAPMWATPFSSNRIQKLEYRFADLGSPWFDVQLDGRTRGREQVDVRLGTVSGKHTLEVRAVNSVGNVERSARAFPVEGLADDAAPFATLHVSPAIGSTGSTFELSAETFDLEGQDVMVRFDTDGDGVFDTPLSSTATTSVQLAKAGTYVLRVEASDANGLVRTAEREVLVLDGNAPPQVSMAPAPSPLNGSDSVDLVFRATDFVDVDGDDMQFNWIQETVGPYGPENRIETGFGDQTSFEATLRTPSDLVTYPVDLLGHDPSPARDVLALGDDRVAVALGSYGVALVDLSDRKAPVELSRISLETAANSLARDGNLLYVLGGQLSVVDISVLTAPVELKQYWTERAWASSVRDDELSVSPGGWTTHEHYVDAENKIERLTVVVDIDHSDPSMLSISLGSDKDVGLGQIELLAEGEAKKGRKHFVFTPGNTPSLKAAAGRFTHGAWQVMVQEHRTIPEGEKPPVLGRLVRSELQFRTAHRAVEVLPGATKIVGVLRHRYPVVAGEGIQVLDAIFPRSVYEAAYLQGDPVADAVLVGSTLIAGSIGKEDDDAERGAGGWFGGFGDPFAPYAEGMYAVDLSWPSWPEIVRMEEDLPVVELASVGSRFYARISARELDDETLGSDYTLVGDPSAFASGDDYVLGESDNFVRSGAFGDDQQIVTLDIRGQVTQLDVSNPAQLSLLQSFQRPYSDRLTLLGNGDMLLSQWMDHRLANINETASTTSQVFQVTLEARDDHGATTTVSRNVHVVPYAHPPTIREVSVVSGRDVEDEWQFRVDIDDVDGAPSWDPYLLATGDLDGDGVMDASWSQQYEGTGASLWTRFPAAGTFTLTFVARDGFWGTSPEASITVDVQEHALVPCGGANGDTCTAEEFCKVEGANACGADGEGVCMRRWQPCDEPEGSTAVCGCDHLDYPTACEASRAGVNVAHEGACPVVPCATNEACDDNQFCSFEVDAEEPSNSCGASGLGTCKVRPEMCYIRFEPGIGYQGACGCDGVTYTNACEANRAGVSVSKYEPCEPPPPDCTETGCEEGSECRKCWGGYVCMPEGAYC